MCETMSDPELRRRPFLASVTGASLALAGCLGSGGDASAIDNGPIADRPAEGGTDDTLYHATDQRITWRWDASSEDWVYFSGTGSETGSVPGTSHFDAARIGHVRAAETPVWNVEAHGIEGDGTTDVGEAVHDLFETVDRAGGGIVYFPPGRYRLERTPLIGNDTILMGAGSSTVLDGPRPAGEEGRALLSNVGYDESGYGGAANWAVCNVRIDAPKANGIMPAHAENVRIENIYGDGIYYHHVDVVSSKNVVVDGFVGVRGGEGDSDAPIQFDNQTAGTVANGVWDGTGSSLVADDDTPTRNCRLSNFEIDATNRPSYGVHVHRDGTELVTIRDGYVTGCEYSAIRVDTGAAVDSLTIERVSCIDNARGITLGEIESGRRALTINNVTIRTPDADVAEGSGIYASGFDGAVLSNVIVDGPFTNSILFDDMADLKLSGITATGGRRQAFRFRSNVDATLSTARAAACDDAGIYVGAGCSVAYGGVTFDEVGRSVVIDGETKAWTTSSDTT